MQNFFVGTMADSTLTVDTENHHDITSYVEHTSVLCPTTPTETNEVKLARNTETEAVLRKNIEENSNSTVDLAARLSKLEIQLEENIAQHAGVLDEVKRRLARRLLMVGT